MSRGASPRPKLVAQKPLEFLLHFLEHCGSGQA